MFINDTDYLDQHFLVDDKVILDFIKSCNLTKDEIVVEVGPGKGTLTKIIAPKVKELTVIELDQRLKEYLDKVPNIKVIYGNVLDIDIPLCDKIITALPYSIIEPFMHKMIKTNFKELYMIMGSNYVNNVINNKITYLSLLTNTFFKTNKLFDIYPESFNPKPRVMSSAVKMVKKEEYSQLDKLFINMFNLNNMKVKNALRESLIKENNITKKESKKIIEELNINEDILNKRFDMLSNDELKIVYDKVNMILSKDDENE